MATAPQFLCGSKMILFHFCMGPGAISVLRSLFMGVNCLGPHQMDAQRNEIECGLLCTHYVTVSLCVMPKIACPHLSCSNDGQSMPCSDLAKLWCVFPLPRIRRVKTFVLRPLFMGLKCLGLY